MGNVDPSRTSVSRAPARRQLAAAAAAQVVLLAALAAGPGLGPAGVLAGLVYAVGGAFVLGTAVRRAGERTLGPAGLVTLGRVLLTGAVTALVADGLVTGAPATAPIVAAAAVALVLDGVDGRVARRTGTSTEFGARFDMESDAVLLLVLSVHVAGELGPWVLLVGLMRYAFVAAAVAAPWLRGSLPARLSAKTVAALQGVALVVAASGLLPRAAAVGLVGAALAGLCWSFGRDVRLLWRARPRAAAAAPAAADTTAPAVPRPRAPQARVLRRTGTRSRP